MRRSVFSFDTIHFEQRLAETIAWCAPRARAEDPRHSLRSEDLRPSILERDRASVVQAVVGYRARDAVPAEGLLGGRLLVYFPDADLADGASEVESRGFFDVHSVPPWDTWVALADDGPSISDSEYQLYVVAWVPPALIDCAQAGIDVSVDECIAWLEDVPVRARHELRSLLHALR